MKYEVCLIIITVLSIIYNTLLLFDKTYSENNVKKKRTIILKRWEKLLKDLHYH